MLVISEISSTEVDRINRLAHLIWPDTFSAILSKEQINYMLNWMYNEDTLAKQIQDGQRFFIVSDSETDLGFIGIEPFFPQQNSFKIHKLYVLTQQHKKGLGKLLIHHVLKLMQQHYAEIKSCYLNVNRFNPAVDFYKYQGFEIVNEEDISIGNGYLMEDFVMKLTIEK